MVAKLKSSARMKKRYMLLNGKRNEIERAMFEYLGVLGFSKAAPFFVSDLEGKIILCVDRKETDNVIASFTLSSDKIDLVRVSGTIKGLSK